MTILSGFGVGGMTTLTGVWFGKLTMLRWYRALAPVLQLITDTQRCDERYTGTL